MFRKNDAPDEKTRWMSLMTGWDCRYRRIQHPIKLKRETSLAAPGRGRYFPAEAHTEVTNRFRQIRSARFIGAKRDVWG